MEEILKIIEETEPIYRDELIREILGLRRVRESFDLEKLVERTADKLSDELYAMDDDTFFDRYVEVIGEPTDLEERIAEMREYEYDKAVDDPEE